MMSCPCNECLCVPTCKNKYWIYLFQDCQLITDYFLYYKDEVVIDITFKEFYVHYLKEKGYI